VNPLRPRRPVALFLNGIGDHVIALPAVRALASAFKGNLALVCLEQARDLFYSGLRLHKAHVIDERRYDARALAERIQECDCFISFERTDNPSTRSLLALLQPAYSVGHLDGFERRVALQNRAAADAAFEIARLFDVSLHIEDFTQSFVAPGGLQALRAAVAGRLGYRPSILAIHCETASHKTWRTDSFAEAVATFLASRPDWIAVVVGRGSGGCFAARAGRRTFDLCGLPLRRSMEVVADADLFVGIDSCMLHVAGISRVPSVAVVGPGSEPGFDVRYTRHRVVRALGPLDELAPGRVTAALENLLSGHPAGSPRGGR
jgi:ADP-heptose:LPS heptosyltransferase